MCQIKSLIEFDSLIELTRYFKDEETCLKFVEQEIWGGDFRCPHCGCDRLYRFKDGKRYRCAGCKEQFTVKVGTIFESSKVPLVKWFIAMWLLGSHKKGISSYQLARDIKVTQKTAWFMLQRIRKSMQQEHTGLLDGVVMSDETFVGGKNRNRHKNKKAVIPYGRNYEDKTPVIGLLQQNGEIRCFITTNTQNECLHPVIENNVADGAILVTDEWRGYKSIKTKVIHEVVQHNQKRYTSKNGFFTNAVEGFWSHLKRAIFGIYHNVSKKHLQRYVDEITFKYNTRLMGEGERIKFMLRKMRCRLKYKQLIQAI